MNGSAALELAISQRFQRPPCRDSGTPSQNGTRHSRFPAVTCAGLLADPSGFLRAIGHKVVRRNRRQSGPFTDGKVMREVPQPGKHAGSSEL